MTDVVLRGEFFKNARGLKIADGGGITWAFDATTNTLTASGGGGGYTDENAQDAVGGILTDSASIDFTYNDGAGTITAAVLPAGVDHDLLANYVANRHIDHTAVSITAGAGLTGGGDISASRTIDVGAGTGIVVNLNDVAVDLTFAFTWTAAHIWQYNANSVQSMIGDNDSNGTANGMRLVLNSGDASMAIYAVGSGRTTAIVTGGPTGAQAVLRTLGAHPIVIGTNDTFRFSIDADGSWTDGAASQGSAGDVWTSNGAAAAPSWEPGGGPGAGMSASTVEVDLGSTAVFRGKFTITDAAIEATSKVTCWQAPGPYTGKGTRADEAEMQPVQVISVEPAAGSAVVKWETPPMTGMVRETQAGRLNAAGATFDRLDNQRWPDTFRPVRIGRVRGNVKFSYAIFA